MKGRVLEQFMIKNHEQLCNLASYSDSINEKERKKKRGKGT